MSERKPQLQTNQPPLGEGSDLPDLLEPESIPEDADHPGRRREPAPMRMLVERTLQRLKLPDQELWREELAQVWPQVVPPEFAAVVRPGKWDHDVLYLFVANSARLFELQRFHLKAMEARLRRHFDAVRLKQVRLMIDPGN